MDLKLTKQSICINEVVFDTTAEQSIELDYMLPDYCKSVFKVLKAKAMPKISSYRIANDKLIIEGMCFVKIIYVCEDNYKLCTVMQKQAFTKTIELKECYQNPLVMLYCIPDYLNCRVVNQHRLDIRGAFCIKATISVCNNIDILSNAEGCGVQISNKPITSLSKSLMGIKEFDITEELELAYGKEPITEIINSTAYFKSSEYKIINGKVIVKGEINLHILYMYNEEKIECMDYAIPVSQIVEVVGIDESYQCNINLDICCCDISMKDNSKFEVTFTIKAVVTADKNEQSNIIDDIYSTKFNLNTAIEKIKVQEVICPINEMATVKTCVSVPQNDISCIYDVYCEFLNPIAKFSENCIEITGTLFTSVLALSCDNMPTCIDKTSACVIKLQCNNLSDNIKFTPYINTCNISYTSISSEEIEVRAELKVCGTLYKMNYFNVINEVNLQEEKTQDNNIALRLYYAKSGERVWDIAKSFNTSMKSIKSENDFEAERLSKNCMMIIPME